MGSWNGDGEELFTVDEEPMCIMTHSPDEHALSGTSLLYILTKLLVVQKKQSSFL